MIKTLYVKVIQDSVLVNFYIMITNKSNQSFPSKALNFGHHSGVECHKLVLCNINMYSHSTLKEH